MELPWPRILHAKNVKKNCEFTELILSMFMSVTMQ